MKYSRQRELIYQKVCEQPLHLTAEAVYNALKEENPKLSLGTVYRNLNTLCDSGLLTRVEVSKGSERFDGDVLPHDHLICEDCGEVVDIPGDVAVDLSAVERATGLHITGHSTIYKGFCSRCQKKHSL